MTIIEQEFDDILEEQQYQDVLIDVAMLDAGSRLTIVAFIHDFIGPFIDIAFDDGPDDDEHSFAIDRIIVRFLDLYISLLEWGFDNTDLNLITGIEHDDDVDSALGQMD